MRFWAEKRNSVWSMALQLTRQGIFLSRHPGSLMFLIYLQVALDIFGGILQRWHPSFCNVFNETKVYVIIRTSSNCLHGENFIGDVWCVMCSSCMLIHFSPVLLFVTLWPVAHQAPLSLGFSWQEYLRELPFPSSGNLPDSGVKPMSLMTPALAGGLFTISATWEACVVPASPSW